MCKSEPDYTFISKFLRKLKSEGEIQYYEDVGLGADSSSFIFQIIQKEEPYRLTIRYKGKVYHCIEVLSLNDDTDFEVIGIYKRENYFNIS